MVSVPLFRRLFGSKPRTTYIRAIGRNAALSFVWNVPVAQNFQRRMTDDKRLVALCRSLYRCLTLSLMFYGKVTRSFSCCLALSLPFSLKITGKIKHFPTATTIRLLALSVLSTKCGWCKLERGKAHQDDAAPVALSSKSSPSPSPSLSDKTACLIFVLTIPLLRTPHRTWNAFARSSIGTGRSRSS